MRPEQDCIPLNSYWIVSYGSVGYLIFKKHLLVSGKGRPSLQSLTHSTCFVHLCCISEYKWDPKERSSEIIDKDIHL